MNSDQVLKMFPREVEVSVEETRPHSLQFATTRIALRAVVNTGNILDAILIDENIPEDKKVEEIAKQIRETLLRNEESLRALAYQILDKDNLPVPANSRFHQ